MYVTENVFDYRLEYIDLDDREFFINAIKIATSDEMLNRLNDCSIDEVKKNYTPVAFISNLSKQAKEEIIINRKTIDWKRARRKFIILDLDFEENQKELSDETKAKLIQFAKFQNTPLLIYPTISYPKKPRYRVVFLTKRALDEKSYFQAVNFIYSQISLKILDKFDTNIKINRNLPIFINSEQIKGIYNTFEDESLEPLNNHLWKDMPKPKTKTKIKYEESEIEKFYGGGKIETIDLLKAINLMKQTTFLDTYDTFWQFLSSIALSCMKGQVDIKDIDVILNLCASATDNKELRKYWEVENKKLFNDIYGRINNDKEMVKKIRPLKTYTEIKKVLNL